MFIGKAGEAPPDTLAYIEDMFNSDSPPPKLLLKVLLIKLELRGLVTFWTRVWLIKAFLCKFLPAIPLFPLILYVD